MLAFLNLKRNYIMSSRFCTTSICLLLCAYLSGFTSKAKAQLLSFQSERSEDYFNNGIEKIELSDYEEVITGLDEAIAIHLQDAEAYLNRGVAKTELGNYEEAIFNFNRGIVKLRLGNYEEAIVDDDESVAIKLQYIYTYLNAYAYLNRGVAKFKLGNYGEAILDFNRVVTKTKLDNNGGTIDDDEAIAINPQHTYAYLNAYAYLNRGFTWFVLGNYEGAILDFNRVIAIYPQNAGGLL